MNALRCGGIFDEAALQIYCNSAGERIVKIDQYLAKLRATVET